MLLNQFSQWTIFYLPFDNIMHVSNASGFDPPHLPAPILPGASPKTEPPPCFMSSPFFFSFKLLLPVRMLLMLLAWYHVGLMSVGIAPGSL